MSLLELGASSGQTSLSALLHGTAAAEGTSQLTIPELAEAITIGGWPGSSDLAVTDAAHAVRDYVEELARADVVAVDGVRRDPARVGRLLRSLARHVATPVTTTTLAADAGGSERPLSRDAVRDYLATLARLMVIEDQPAWGPHLRSRSTVRLAPKRHFVDPSLAVAAMRGGVDRLLDDLELLGLLFESMVVRDLRVYAQPLDGTVFHHRDSYGREVDAIVETADGRWAVFEIKLGASQIDAAAAGLVRFVDGVDTERCGLPAALGVIVPGGHAFTRQDGVSVIPAGTLGP